MSATFHLSLDVPDLDAAVAFYGQLLGSGPAKRKPGYAKFELADPPLALALQQAARPGLSHLGIRVDDTATVERASTRLRPCIVAGRAASTVGSPLPGRQP